MDWNKLSDYKTIMAQKRRIKELFADRELSITVKIAILAGSTVGILKEFLEIFLYQYDIKAVFWEGDYNRVYEDAVFRNKELDAFAPDIVYIHVNNYNLKFNECISNDVSAEYEKWLQIWESLHVKYGCYLIQNNFEYYPYRIIGNASRYMDNGLLYCVDQLNLKISEYAKNHNWFLLNDINYLSSLTGLENWFNERFWTLYKYPFDMSVQPKVAANLASLIKAVLGKNKKTIITDLDNTLWKGIIGEVGVEKIEMGNDTPLGEEFNRFQNYLAVLRQYGILLNICSKNDYEVAIQGLADDRSVLKADHFVNVKINWEDKYKNIDRILKDINLGSEATVFVDDSLLECDSVKSFLPEVTCIQMESVQNSIQAIEDGHYFEIVCINEEDRNRELYYKQNQQREKDQALFSDFDEYLESLNMKCVITGINDNNQERIVQLANKTNQFNLTNWRLTQQDVLAIQKNEEYITLNGKLADKYGDNGIVSSIIAKQNGESVQILLWIMSCRVFKRGLEYCMWNELYKECRSRGIKVIYGSYIPSAKNQRIKEFYGELGFVKVKEDAKEELWMLEMAEDKPVSATKIQVEREV